jgi:hypothetical protein
LRTALLPDGQSVFDFGDIWEGALTRAKTGAEYDRVYPGGTLQSNFNVMYRVAARLKDPQAQAVAERYASFGHSNLEEFWTLLWRDPSLAPRRWTALPLAHHFKIRVSCTCDRRGRRTRRRSRSRPARPRVIEPRRCYRGFRNGGSTAAMRIPMPAASSCGHTAVSDRRHRLRGLALGAQPQHDDVRSDGQGVETQHDVWRSMDYAALDGIRIREAEISGGRARIVADLAAAYPKTAGVTSFTRTFAWDGGSTITVGDVVTLAAPKSAEWHLQSDTPFAGSGNRYRNGRDGEPALSVVLRVAEGCVCDNRCGHVKAPGPPGSIETGAEEAARLPASRGRAGREDVSVRL